MADAVIILPPDSSGKGADHESVTGTGVGGTVYRQRNQIAGVNAPEIARVTNGTPLATDYGVVVRQASSFPDTVGSTVALNALNIAASVPVAGQTSVGVFLAAGTLIGTLVPEISFDGGTTWVASIFIDPTSGSYSLATSLVYGAANTAASLSIQTGGGVTNARVRVSAFTSGTANCTLRATQQEDNIIAIFGKPHVALGHYTVTGRTATYSSLAALAPLVQFRNPSATVLVVVYRVTVWVVQTVVPTTAGAQQRELIVGRGWTAADSTATTVAVTGNANKRRTSQAASIINLLWGTPLTAGTRTLDSNPLSQAVNWAFTSTTTGAGTHLGMLIPQTDLFLTTHTNQHPLVLAQNEGLLIRIGADAQLGSSTQQTYFEFEWAEVAAY